MKITRRKCLISLGSLVGVGLLARVCFFGTGNYFSSIDVQVPNSAIVSQQNYPSLTGDEDLILLRLSPAQMRVLLTQFKMKRDFSISPRKIAPTRDYGFAPKTAFFSKIPVSASSGGFRFDHTESSPHWPTFCSFAIDKISGRVWFYAWSVYN